MFHFLQKKMLKKICSKGTSNVLQGGSAEYGQTPHFYIFLDPSLICLVFGTLHCWCLVTDWMG